MLKILQARPQQYVNRELQDVQAGFKITRRTINNLSYADDTTLMAESEDELKSLLMKVKEESERDGNIRPPDLTLEKPVCGSGNNS